VGNGTKLIHRIRKVETPGPGGSMGPMGNHEEVVILDTTDSNSAEGDEAKGPADFQSLDLVGTQNVLFVLVKEIYGADWIALMPSVPVDSRSLRTEPTTARSIAPWGVADLFARGARAG
jgi:hypothetical protein